MTSHTMALSKASAVQPAATEHLPLAMLNRASAKVGGSWEVAVYNPYEDHYEYNWKNSLRTGTTFVVTFVAANDPSQYCLAQFKKSTRNTNKYDQVRKQIEQNRRLVISRVSFADDAKLQYVSCPLKLVVDLCSTKLDAVVNAPSSVVQPAPKNTVAGCAELTGNQFFDLIALIHEVLPVREHANNRSSFVLKIYDGSLDRETAKVKIMPLTIYYDTTPSNIPKDKSFSGEKMKAFAQKHMESKTPLCFFNISGAQDDQNKFVFRSSKHILMAEAVGDKAEKLKANTALHHLSTADTTAFETQTTQIARDWALVHAKETKCALLLQFARKPTGISAMDDAETIWQINWVRIAEPPQDQHLRNQFGNLWLPLTCMDDTGIVTLYITEAALLKLAKAVDAAEFEELFKQGRLRLPFYASIRILRRPSNTSAAQPGGSSQPQQKDNDFDCYIVDAAEQTMEEIPTASSMKLLPMLSLSTDGWLHAMLAQISSSEHYALMVQYAPQQVPPELASGASRPTQEGATIQRPCSKAIALISSTNRSHVFPAGATGHKLVTENVVDLLHTDSAITRAADGAQRKYQIITYCTLDNVTDFKLDPPKGSKEQAALISVVGVINADTDDAEQPVKGFIVDDIVTLSETQANAYKPLLMKQLHFAALTGQISRKRALEQWSPTQNPAEAKSCKALGRSPSGPVLPDYADSQ